MKSFSARDGGRKEEEGCGGSAEGRVLGVKGDGRGKRGRGKKEDLKKGFFPVYSNLSLKGGRSHKKSKHSKVGSVWYKRVGRDDACYRRITLLLVGSRVTGLD